MRAAGGAGSVQGVTGVVARAGAGEGRGSAPLGLDRGQLDPSGTARKKVTSRLDVGAQA